MWERFADLPEAVVPWLFGIARNLIREQRRAEGRRAALAVALDLTTRAADLSTGDVAEEVTERVAVLRALGALSDAERETLTLVAWQGLTAKQAAQVVGCSQAAFWVRLHRARRRLQQATDALMHNADALPGGPGTGDILSRGLTPPTGIPRALLQDRPLAGPLDPSPLIKEPNTP